MEFKHTRDTVQNLIAFNVLRKMEDKGTTVTELADYCNVTVASITQFLKGRQFVSARFLADLCNFFQCAPHELFKWTPPEESTDEEDQFAEG
jgi:transcriptional regulator with XRE-family HTH domain